MPKRIIRSKKRILKNGKRRQRKSIKRRKLKTIKGGAGLGRSIRNLFTRKGRAVNKYASPNFTTPSGIPPTALF